MLSKIFGGQKLHQHYVILFQPLLHLLDCGRILWKKGQNGRTLFNQVLTSWKAIRTNLQMFILLQWMSVSLYSISFCSFQLQLEIDSENKLSFLCERSDKNIRKQKKSFWMWWLLVLILNYILLNSIWLDSVLCFCTTCSVLVVLQLAVLNKFQHDLQTFWASRKNKL